MSKATSVGEKNKKGGQSKTIFLTTERKTSIQVMYMMSDEESHSVRKRMWKITSGVFIVFFLGVALKRAIS